GQTYRQSPSILEVIADATGKLGGKTPLERVRMREWLYWDLDRLALPIYRMRGQRIGVRMMGQSVAEMLFAEGNVALKVLDDHLAGRDWMVGDALSIADVDIYCVLDFAAAGGFATDDFPAVAAFMTRVQALPGFGFPADIIPKSSRTV
ncbi:MAG: glutathione S-transferase, partial [Rhizobiaceae bacterium]